MINYNTGIYILIEISTQLFLSDIGMETYIYNNKTIVLNNLFTVWAYLGPSWPGRVPVTPFIVHFVNGTEVVLVG